jgi:hypothetical protein
MTIFQLRPCQNGLALRLFHFFEISIYFINEENNISHICFDLIVWKVAIATQLTIGAETLCREPK